MTTQEKITRWRSLPPEEKLRRRWEAIPLDVAQSMAFEREPVPMERITAIAERLSPFQGSPNGLAVSQSSALARIEPPALLKRRKGS